MSRDQSSAYRPTDSRLEDEIKFWVRLSSDLIGETDKLPPTPALAALRAALNRFLAPTGS